jgi:xanthine dehydrogenase small subunit
MRNHLHLYINGQPHTIHGQDAFLPLSTYLREKLGLTGTKVVCAEGDCGSCSILLGRPNESTISYQPVCSCIQYMLQLDATHILTVEGLAQNGALNPLQDKMVQLHGAQCGYCTPGFIVAMADLLDKNKKPTEHDLRRGLVGNLCRCTGYESILKAGLTVDTTRLQPLEQLYDTKAIATDLAAREKEPVEIRTETRAFAKPTTLEHALQFRTQNPTCIILSGGTDIGVQLNKSLRDLTTVLSTSALHDLESITIQDNAIHAGARASLSDLERITLTHLHEFAKMLAFFGSPLIKNAATLGGNIANGSPIGDTMPALFVLSATIELTGKTGPRTVNINDFYTAYRKNVMQPDELITKITIPLPAPSDLFKIYKISKRKDLDISTFMAAIHLRPHIAPGLPGVTARSSEDAPTIAAIRIACGGVAPTIVRLPKTEAFLTNKPMTEETFTAAGKLARSEVRPISDVRGDADYRLQLVENIFSKFFYDIAPQSLATNGKEVA